MTRSELAQLTEAERELARRTFVTEGVFSRVMEAITGGAFLAGLALYVGASTLAIAVLAAMPFLAQVAHLVAVPILTRWTNRRRIVVLASGLSRGLLLLIALGVWVQGSAFGSGPLIAIMTASAVLIVVSTAAWNWWVRDVIPRGELGQYFGRRLRITTLIASLFQLGAGAFLDYFDGQGLPERGFAGLFLAGGVAGLLSTFFLARTPHVRPPRPAPAGNPVRIVATPLRDGPTRRLAVALSLVAATLTVALPYTAVFLIRTLEISFFLIAVLTATSQVGYVAGLRGWGYLTDRFGNRPVFQIALGMMVVTLAGWGLLLDGNATRLLLPLFALHFVSGFSVGGIELMASNILLKMAPENGVPAFFASLSVTRAVTAGVATLVAGAAWEAMGTGALVTVSPFGWGPWTFRGFHVLAWASAVLGLVAILAFRRVAEPGHAPVADVAKAMRREVRMISSIAGIRAFVHVVSYAVEAFTRPRTGAEEERAKPRLPVERSDPEVGTGPGSRNL